jgi:mannose-6-phosphate isomerase-like protein (cupin superfamily)
VRCLSDITTNGFRLKKGKGTTINFHGTKITVKVSGDDSGGRYTLIEMEHPPNTGPALHIHSKAPEAYYVLDGQYSIRCDNEIYHAQSGDFVFIPKGIPHNYQSGSQGGKVLVISPAGLEGYFREVADILGNQDNKISWNEEIEIARRYGQEFLDILKHWSQ